MDSDLRERARLLVEDADNRPHEAIDAATRLAEHDDGVVVLRAHHAHAIALRALHRIEDSRLFIDQALEIATTEKADVDIGLVLLTRASLRLLWGDDEGCQSDLDEASPWLTGIQRIDLQAQRGAIAHKLGAYDVARQAYDEVLTLTIRYDRPRERARSLSNLGLLAIHLGNYAEAEQHLSEAVDIFTELDHIDGVLFAGHNLGYLHMCRGAVPQALQQFSQVTNRAQEIGVEIGILCVDQAAALLEAGLLEDALEGALHAASLLTDAGELVERTDALVIAASAARALGDTGQAVKLAEEACAAADLVHRPAWSAVAALTRLAAHLEEDSQTDLAEVDELITTLARSGLTPYLGEALFIGVRAAVASGDTRRAAALCDELNSVARRHGSLARARCHLAQALLDERRGNFARARRQAEVAMSWSLRFAAGMGSIETRFSSSYLAVAAAELALRVTATARALPVLRRMDAVLDATFALPRLRPVNDPQLAHNCERFRAAQVALGGAVQTGSSGDDLAQAIEAVRRSERDINVRVRSIAIKEASVEPLRRAAVFREALTSVDLLACGVARDQRSISVVDGVARIHDGTEAIELENLAGKLAKRLAHDAAVGQMSKATLSLAERVDRLLIPAVVRQRSDSQRTLVVVPGSRLAMPFLGALPSLCNQKFVTAPSFGAYIDSAARPMSPAAGGALFVEGPDLGNALGEIEEASGHYSSATVLRAHASTTRAVKDRMNGSLAHFACHARVRRDNPMFSELVLADGPLAIHELQVMPQLPSTVVLAGCRTAAVSQRPGRVAIGLSESLLMLGVRSVVATQLDVNDRAAARAMRAFHAEVAAGCSVANALQRLRLRDTLDAVTAAFTVVGADSELHASAVVQV